MVSWDSITLLIKSHSTIFDGKSKSTLSNETEKFWLFLKQQLLFFAGNRSERDMATFPKQHELLKHVTPVGIW